MPRGHRCPADPDALSSPEDDDEVFDTDKLEGGSDTDATSIEDLDVDDGVFDDEFEGGSETDAASVEDLDVDDQIKLFGGNVHPPEYYQQAVEEFNEAAFNCEGYSPGTSLLLDSVDKQWHQFRRLTTPAHMRDALDREPQCYFESLSVGLLYNFFDWKLNQKVNKDGRKLGGTRKRSSLGTYWKVFRLVVERAVGDKVDPKLNRSMHKVLPALAKKHGLSDQRRANRCMTIDGLKQQVETTLSTTKKSFKLGELRILAVLFLLLVAPAGARTASVLRLRYSDLLVALTRDPEGGPHNLLIKFTLAFTKTYLGEKDAKTYPLPETLFDESLLLSPHIFLLGILFRHRAFLAPTLTSPHHLDKLDIHPEDLEMLLPLRKDLDNVYVFRRAVQTLTGYVISDEPISPAMMAAWTRRVGELMGLEITVIPYSLRYNAANEWTSSPDISEALRNLAMDHASSVPVQRHYLGRNLDKDLFSILKGTKPQHALVKQSCSVGHSISKRRPISLTAEQSASVNTHPLIRRLKQKIRALRPESQQYKETRRLLRKEKQRLRRELRQKIRDEWTAAQAVEDIERQLQGCGFAQPAVDTPGRPQRPAQRRLVEALTAPAVADLEGLYRRRNNAIDAVIAYCVVEEGCTVPRTPATEPARSSGLDPPAERKVYTALLSVFVRSKQERPRRCFLCVGKALSLSPEDSYIEDLVREFYTSGDLSKHFRRKHLSKLQASDSSHCQVCDMALEHKMHLQNHALKIHGIVS